jgi:hypothetical protein
MKTIYSPSTVDVINEQRTPKYINCKFGFINMEFAADNSINFAGFTQNMRKATPLYCSAVAAMEIGKLILRKLPTNCEYFVVVVPCMINFNKEQIK